MSYAYATVNKPPPAMNPARPDAGTVNRARVAAPDSLYAKAIIGPLRFQTRRAKHMRVDAQLYQLQEARRCEDDPTLVGVLREECEVGAAADGVLLELDDHAVSVLGFPLSIRASSLEAERKPNSTPA